MCGWVGSLGQCPDEHNLKLAGDTMLSRGPDGSGERRIPIGPMPAGFAHRRLAILDTTEAGAQPMHDAERGVTVVYNGEIYNSPQLRRELQAQGVRFHSTSDTEVLLLGWAEWGDQILDRIEGIFSFALFDERRGRALLARDHLGVKPLYWAEINGGVVAASAPRAILALRPELRADLDRVALAQFLMLLWIPHPRSPWTRIRKLPRLMLSPSKVAVSANGGTGSPRRKVTALSIRWPSARRWSRRPPASCSVTSLSGCCCRAGSIRQSCSNTWSATTG